MHEFRYSFIIYLLIFIAFFVCFIMRVFLTHLSWPSGIGLGSESVLILKVSSSILSGVNLRGLV